MTTPAAERLRLAVGGMTCAACAGRIERALNALPGVAASVNLATETAEIGYDPIRTTPVELAGTVEAAGYDVPHDRRDLAVSGMTCASCAARVERALLAVPGVLRAEVNPATERARVEGVALRPSLLIGAVAGAGYAAELLTGDAEREAAREAEAARRARREAARVVAAALLTLPLLLPMLGHPLPGWLALILATPVQFVIAAPFYAAAWRAVRARSGNMDLLVSLGTSAAWLRGAWGVATGRSADSFEAAAVVITLVLLGRWLEARARRRTGAAIRALTALRPQRARVERDGEELDLPVAALSPGDVLVVRPGESVPADGVVLSGAGGVDESLLTGEALPVDKAPGAAVVGGSINGDGLLRIEVTRAAEDSTLARIIGLVEGAQARKAPVQRLADRISAVFVPVVLAAAALTLLGWWLAGAPAAGLDAAVAVLVVACPCSLGLATPTALIAGTGAAARAGILIRDAEALERARSVDTVVLDKTGTLTEGRPEVVEIVPRGIGTAELIRLAASAQRGSEHPLARAVIARAAGETLLPLDEFVAQPGRGLLARVGGRRLAIGTPALLAAHGLAPVPDPDAERLEAAGCTVMRVATLDPDPVLLGLIAVADPVRPSATEAVRRLHAAGLRPVLLTGDNAGAARIVAQAVGIAELRAGVLPDGKAAEIARLQAQGRRVAMVGDGVNDAPALAQADLGIAMGGGADAARQAAGITLMRADPLLVADAVAVSRATWRKVRGNLAWAFLFNALGIPLAAAGLLGPMLAGGAMAFSSVAVVGNALLLRRWHPARTEAHATTAGDR